MISKLNQSLLEIFRPQNAFENLLRGPYEFVVSGFAGATGSLMVLGHEALALSLPTSLLCSSFCFGLSYLRAAQGWEVVNFQRNLLKPEPFTMSMKEIPYSKKELYIGKGFKWGIKHRQRLHLLSQVANEKYLKGGLFRPAVKADIGGKPWLHGVGALEEMPINLPQSLRNSHIIVFGMTRVGKTRFSSIVASQDILNGEAVLFIDPKGDEDLLRDLFEACVASRRLLDFTILHAGYPDISAKYNPLASYFDVSELATRITGAISASGEGKQFQDFAWKFANITLSCMAEMGEPLNMKNFAFFVARPKQTLLAYCDRVLPRTDPDYLAKVETIIQEFRKVEEDGSFTDILRSKAVNIYLQRHIEEIASKGGVADSTITDLHHAANVGDEFYGKITASLGPVLDKINKTSARDIFSWDHNFGLPEVKLEEVIKRKKILYVGLDAMTNKAMAEAIGQAMIADLVSLAGRLYKESNKQETSLCIHVDEFAEVVRDEFVTLLNKAGGAGFKVIAYTQTVNDIVAVLGSHDKAQMILGNFGTKIMLRVANDDTARVMTNAVEEVFARSTSPSTTTHDKSENSNDLFTTTNTDTINESQQRIIVENDLTSLPKGQAFVLTNGGELYKIRIPLPKNDGNAPRSIAAIMSGVNL